MTLRTENADFVIDGTDTGQEIAFDDFAYHVAIAADSPLRSVEIYVQRTAYFESDILLIEEEFATGYGDNLTCLHQFDMSAVHWDRLSVSGSLDTRFEFGEGAECLNVYPAPVSCFTDAEDL